MLLLAIVLAVVSLPNTSTMTPAKAVSTADPVLIVRMLTDPNCQCEADGFASTTWVASCYPEGSEPITAEEVANTQTHGECIDCSGCDTFRKCSSSKWRVRFSFPTARCCNNYHVERNGSSQGAGSVSAEGTSPMLECNAKQSHIEQDVFEFVCTETVPSFVLARVTIDYDCKACCFLK